MKIEKAIEILTHLKAATNSASRQECDEAYQLGIEALKGVKAVREKLFWGGKEESLLPGETLD